jgi:diguanylate cyclase (GGDEF)-like protein
MARRRDACPHAVAGPLLRAPPPRPHSRDTLSKRAVLTLVLPGMAALATVAALLALPPAIEWQAAGAYPFVALAVALFLAGRLQKSRSFFIAGLLAGAFGVLRASALQESAFAHAVAAAYIPIALTALACARDVPVVSRRALLTQLTPAATLLVSVLVAARLNHDGLTPLLTHDFIDPVYTSWSGLHQTALALWLLCAGTLAFRAVRSGQPVDAGVAWGALCTALALGTPAGVSRGVWELSAGVALSVALVEASRVMALHDELTGLPARRALSQGLASLRAPYTIAIIDIDHFKMFNDRHGHDVGDQVLRMVASRLERVGGGGTAFRSGGEEFTVVFPDVGRKEAMPHLESLREVVAAAAFTLRASDRPRSAEGSRQRGRARGRGQRLSVTISVGAASPTARTASPEAVVKAADKAMYRAKQNGRNRVAV